MTSPTLYPARTTTFRPATDKQVAFITRLAAERGVPTETAGLSSSYASGLITFLLALPKATPAAGAPSAERVTEPGMYRTAAGDIFKVQASRDDATRLYAKQLTPIGGQRLTETDDTVRFEFAYVAGAIKSLTPADRMSLDDAKAFGIRYGVCCVCGAPLKDATSVARGIGPVCITKV